MAEAHSLSEQLHALVVASLAEQGDGVLVLRLARRASGGGVHD
jgi:hypothetical protein